MKKLRALIDTIVHRVNINLRNPSFDVAPLVKGVIPVDRFAGYDAFYALAPDHPFHYHFSGSALAGSHLTGRCAIDRSVLYECSIRGDELMSAEDTFSYHGVEIALDADEIIRIDDSYLVRTLVHGHSHDPERPEELLVRNSVSLDYADIQGSSVQGSLLGPFSTVEFTALHDCVVGPYAYVQAGSLRHRLIEAGRVRICSQGLFDFSYLFPSEVLQHYIHMEAGKAPRGVFVDFAGQREKAFHEMLDLADPASAADSFSGASLSRHAALKGNNSIAEKVFVAEGAYLRDARLERGSSALENCTIIDSEIGENGIADEGSRIMHSKLHKEVFVGSNCFLRGQSGLPLTVESGCILMPHTIIDLAEPLKIPHDTIVWGYIRSLSDLTNNSLSAHAFSRIEETVKMGRMHFEGSGARFIEALHGRIELIRKAVGGHLFDSGTKGRLAHDEEPQYLSFHIIQPYPEGDCKGLCPTMDIAPCEPQ